MGRIVTCRPLILVMLVGNLFASVPVVLALAQLQRQHFARFAVVAAATLFGHDPLGAVVSSNSIKIYFNSIQTSYVTETLDT